MVEVRGEEVMYFFVAKTIMIQRGNSVAVLGTLANPSDL